MQKRTLGDSLEVSALGLGCMGMTTAYPPVPREGSDGLADPGGRRSRTPSLRVCARGL
jgi:aryl-alcohol dehydrogenase-like predicted oxidoreductase